MADEGEGRGGCLIPLAGLLAVVGLIALWVWLMGPVQGADGANACDKASSYEAQQRLTHHGKLPAVDSFRVWAESTSCGADN